MRRWLTASVLCVMLSSILGGGNAAAAVSLDAVFKPVLASRGVVRGIAPLANGQVMIIGDFATVSGVACRGIARLNGNGTVDETFHLSSDLQVNGIQAVAVQPDGKILIGGYLSLFGATSFRNYLFRLNSDGSLDNSFDAGGFAFATGTSYGIDGPVSAIQVLPGGKIVVGGSFTVPANNIARLNADGTPDASFTPGTGTDGTVTRIARQSTGHLVIAGTFTSVNGTAKSGIARLDANGVLDAAAFGTGVYGGNVLALTLQADDKVLFGGNFFMVNGVESYKVVRFSAAGVQDTTFVPQYFGHFEEVTSLAASGSYIFVGGWDPVMYFNGRPTDHDAVIYVLGLATGGFHSYVKFQGDQTDVWALAPRSDGLVVAGGSFLQQDDPSDLNLYPGSCLLTGQYFKPAPSFRPIVGGQATVRSLALQADGNVLAAGDFVFAGAAASNGIARFTPAGALDATLATPSVVGGAVTGVLARGDGKIVMGGTFSSVNGLTYTDVALLGATGSMETGTYVGGVSTLAWYPGDKVVAGMYHSPGVRRLGSDLTIEGADTFDPGTGISNNIQPDGELDRVNAVAVQPDGKILVAGSFGTFSGTPRQNIVRLNANGTIDGSFTSPAFTVFNFRSEVFSVAVQPDGKILVAGRFSTVGGVASPIIARLNPDGTVDGGFQSPFGNSGASAYHVSLQPDGKILVGGSMQITDGATIYNNLVRLNASGAHDTGFYTDIYGPVRTLAGAPTTGGHYLYVGGSFASAEGSPRQGLARYLVPTQYLLTVTRDGSGSGDVTPDSGSLAWNGNAGTGMYDSGTSVVLTASASVGSVFTGWSGAGCSGVGTCTVAMTVARSVTAGFALSNSTLTVATTGTGSVHSDPGGISCIGSGAGCSASFGTGSTVTLLATPSSAPLFLGWGGACAACVTGTCPVIMNDARSCTASFAAGPMVKLVRGSLTEYHASPAAAYAATMAGSDITVMAMAGEFPGPLVMDRNVAMHLEGGYGDTFVTRSGDTYQAGSVTVGAGSLTADRLNIR